MGGMSLAARVVTIIREGEARTQSDIGTTTGLETGPRGLRREGVPGTASMARQAGADRHACSSRGDAATRCRCDRRAVRGPARDEPIQEILGRQWASEMVALDYVAAVVAEPAERLLVLDALGDDGRAEAVAELDVDRTIVASCSWASMPATNARSIFSSWRPKARARGARARSRFARRRRDGAEGDRRAAWALSRP